ncbi:MAG: hypothetical protein M5U19_21620 [Microthrixaceae bacterium]|nr:hypothetical protein [Microthrixaceae bacterium]
MCSRTSSVFSDANPFSSSVVMANTVSKSSLPALPTTSLQRLRGSGEPSGALSVGWSSPWWRWTLSVLHPWPTSTRPPMRVVPGR